LAKYGIAFLIGCSSQILVALRVALAYRNPNIADRLKQSKIGCYNKKLTVSDN